MKYSNQEQPGGERSLFYLKIPDYTHHREEVKAGARIVNQICSQEQEERALCALACSLELSFIPSVSDSSGSSPTGCQLFPHWLTWDNPPNRQVQRPSQCGQSPIDALFPGKSKLCQVAVIPSIRPTCGTVYFGNANIRLECWSQLSLRNFPRFQSSRVAFGAKHNHVSTSHHLPDRLGRAFIFALPFGLRNTKAMPLLTGHGADKNRPCLRWTRKVSTACAMGRWQATHGLF